MHMEAWEVNIANAMVEKDKMERKEFLRSLSDKRLVKTGRFAFGGVRIVDINMLGDLRSYKEVEELMSAGWLVQSEKYQVEEVKEEELTELDLIIQEQDKEALDEYAKELGVKLDRRKSFAKMLAEFKEA